MVKKKVDPRVRALIEYGIRSRHRSMFAIVGDHGRDQVVNLHYILSKCQVKARPNVLWCFKKELGFSTYKQKRMKEVKKAIARGTRDVDRDDPFDLFVNNTNIRWCYYKDTESVLGKTFGMCVLQDFEALTPNVIARTIETVEGGGMIILLLNTVSSLKQLYTMTMDVHSKFRPDSSFGTIVPRFNQRFVLSLSNNPACLALDDELNVLNVLHNSIDQIIQIGSNDDDNDKDDDMPMGNATLEVPVDDDDENDEFAQFLPILRLAKTADQRRGMKTLIHSFSSILSPRNPLICHISSARGRGKSALLGLTIACIIHMNKRGEEMIMVTGPPTAYCDTLFEFLLLGLSEFGLKEIIDYDLTTDSNSHVKRIHFKATHTTIEYVDCDRISVQYPNCMICIDEAAAIPTPHMKKILNLSFPAMIVSSTHFGYEGTGRSLSLKLIQSLKKHFGANFVDVKLNCPIRYNEGDHVENWLLDLLCLKDYNDSDNVSSQDIVSKLSSPQSCKLLHINKDLLFYGANDPNSHQERLLHSVWSVLTSSHYKNQPNDLQVLSDSPNHEIFALVNPDARTGNNNGGLPKIITVVQVCYEGNLSSSSSGNSHDSSGDLIPWTLSQQYLTEKDDLLSHAGVRVVRIATCRKYQGMGYGSETMKLLQKTFSSSSTSTSTSPTSLLQSCHEYHVPHMITWIGSCFGLTKQLANFWFRLGYRLVYLRQTANMVTGELSSIFISNISDSGLDFRFLHSDYSKRLVWMLSNSNIDMKACLDIHTCLVLLNDVSVNTIALSEANLQLLVSEYDLVRLEAYCKNFVDFHMIMDLVPILARLYFTGYFVQLVEDDSGRTTAPLHLSVLQKACLIGIGMLNCSIDDVCEMLQVDVRQALGVFNKAIRKMTSIVKTTLGESESARIMRTRLNDSDMKPLEASLDDEQEADVRKRKAEEGEDLMSKTGNWWKKKPRSMEEVAGRLTVKEFDNSEVKMTKDGKKRRDLHG